MEPASILSFLAITALLIVTPGADMALISRAAMRRGQLGAFSAMLGINCASLLWTLLAAAGLVALAETVPFASIALMATGAAYMGYVGTKDIRSGMAARSGSRQTVDETLGRETGFSLFRNGFFVNITNPKIGLYYATVLPNFISQGANPGKYIALMGITHNILGFAWFMTFSALLIRGANLLGSQTAKAYITLVTGAALVTFSAVAFYYLASRVVS